MSDALASIAASFGIGIGLGPGAEDSALTAAGLPARSRCRPPVFPYMPNPIFLGTTAVGTFVTLGEFSPQSGWVADITSMAVTGFSAGTVVITRGAPFVDGSGNPIAIEQIARFPSQGPSNFPQKGNPLLDANDLLYATVASALTAPNGVVISGTGIMVPLSRLDDYLS